MLHIIKNQKDSLSMQDSFTKNAEIVQTDKTYRAAWIITFFVLAGLVLIFIANGTADEGDSVMHYLYARHAFQYPENFLNQWAKPLYVLIVAPVAQLGFTAVKLFNLLASAGSLWLVFKIVKKTGLADSWMAIVLTAFAPMMMIVTLSGLTEPLFAFWMMAGIYGLYSGKRTSAVIWLSFIPFIRSEGLIVLCVILLYLLVKRSFRHIPFLLTGHLLYAIIGYPLYKDPLWVFTQLSYATLNSAYGQGHWTDFIKGMPEIIGWPIYILLIIGSLYGLYLFIARYFLKRKEICSEEELFLIYGCFMANFVGHSAFWALGIFNSFGLLRVMIGVMPLMGLISLRGLNFISDSFRSHFIKYFLLFCVIAFPFTGTRYSFKWKRDFSLKADQKAELRMADYLKTNYPDYKKYAFYYEACWISVVLDLNHFDNTQHKRFLNAFEDNNFPAQSFLVWDDWFARVEGRVELQQLLDD
ncbi:MAG: hypothetical protein ABIR18_15225, partial [Chitinophagaceae bacterium]